MLNVHRERSNPVKKHSKVLVFFAVSKQIPIVYSADRGRAEITTTSFTRQIYLSHVMRKPVFGVFDQVRLKPACAAIEAS